jgi:CDP-diacylglycerol--glycerol-3-phosphate 3-phosphatidyltransferase/cardiolipin synthase
VSSFRLELDGRDLWNVAGLLTLSRLSMAVAAPAFTHDPQALAMLLALAMFTDVIDGPIARATGQVSRTGAMIDGFVDKVFLVNFAWTLSVGDWVPYWILLPWFVREIVQGAMFPFMVWRYFVGQAPWPEPSNVGKVATVALAIAMFGGLYGSAAVLYGFTALCGVTGVLAVIGYWHRDKPLGESAPLPLPSAVQMRR